MTVFLALCFRIACYLGIGAMFYAVFVSTNFDPHSILMWAWLLAWPFACMIMFIALFGAVALAAIALGIAGLITLGYYAKIQAWVKRRRTINMLRRGTSQR